MASYTPNYNLKKPADADSYDIADANGNMDLIDAALHSQNEAIANLNGSKAITVSDYNDLITTGVYKAEATSNALHAPNPVSPGSWYVVSVWKTGVYITQIAHTTTYNKTYIRGYYTGAGWTDWQELALNSNTLKKTSLKITSGNLDDYYGDDKAGLYYVGSGVTNSELDYSGLIVIAQESYGAQIQFNYRSIVVRTRTGNPATWSNWTYLTQSLANGYVGANQTKTYALSARITYILTISNIASNNIENIYTAMVVAPPSSSNTGKIVWLTSTPPNSVTVSLSGLTLTVASSSNIWITVALTRM